MIYCTLGELLIKFNLTQKDISEATGIGVNTIGRYCNNTWSRFDKDHLKILCKYFDCDVTLLLRFFPVEEGVDENLMKNAIRYRLLNEEYSQLFNNDSE